MGRIWDDKRAERAHARGGDVVKGRSGAARSSGAATNPAPKGGHGATEISVTNSTFGVRNSTRGLKDA